MEDPSPISRHSEVIPAASPCSQLLADWIPAHESNGFTHRTVLGATHAVESPKATSKNAHELSGSQQLG